MVDPFNSPRCPICNQIYQQEGSTLFFLTRRDDQLGRRRWPERLSYSDARPCNVSHTREVRWLGCWNGQYWRFEMKDNAADGDCLLHAINDHNIVRLQRPEVVNWLQEQVGMYIHHPTVAGTLTAALECLALEMLTPLHHYRHDHDAFERDLSMGLPEAYWAQPLLQYDHEVSLILAEIDKTVRFPLYLRGSCFAISLTPLYIRTLMTITF